jgi:cytochrome P450
VCPGASLARLEARVAVEVFLDNVASVAPLQPGRYDPVVVTWAHGPQALDVELVPVARLTDPSSIRGTHKVIADGPAG